MSGNFVLQPVLFLSAQSLAASFNSTGISLAYANLAGIQCNWSGSAVGTITFQGSLDNANWTTLVTSANFSVNNATDTGLLDILDTGLPYIRVVYTRSSGTGSMDIYVNYKQT